MDEQKRKKLEAAIAFHNSKGATADEQTRQRLAELEEQRQQNWQHAATVQQQAERLKITRQDEKHELMVSASTSMEALSWLQIDDDALRSISGGGGDSDMIAGAKAIRMVRRLYANGAVRVTAVEVFGLIEKTDHQDTDTLVIELPSDAGARAAIFKQVGTQARKRGYDATKDEGQKYLLMWWD